MILFIGLFVLFMIMNSIKGVEEKKKKKKSLNANAQYKHIFKVYNQHIQ